jgi:proteasome lid subunit RPN8/RPN11
VSAALTLGPGVLAAIQDHSADTYPHECCGALLGRGGTAEEAWPLPNTTEEGPRRRFLVRPADYRAAEARAGQRGLDLLGFYHSHPDHPAHPSEYDLAHAWPVFSYVIIAVREGRPGEITSWKLAEDRSVFEPEALTF